MVDELIPDGVVAGTSLDTEDSVLVLATRHQYRTLLKLFGMHTPDDQEPPRACLLSYAIYPPLQGVRANSTHFS